MHCCAHCVKSYGSVVDRDNDVILRVHLGGL